MRGNAWGLLVMDILFGSMTSALPEGSLKIFLMNVVITIIGMSFSHYWYRTVPNTVRYNSLVAFVMMISLGIICRYSIT